MKKKVFRERYNQDKEFKEALEVLEKNHKQVIETMKKVEEKPAKRGKKSVK